MTSTNQRYATSTSTRTLYTLARRERDSREFVTLSHLVDERDAIARMQQDGVERAHASALTREAGELAHVALIRAREAASSGSAILALPRALDGDYITQYGLGPSGDGYRLIATVVSAPSVPVA